MIGLACGAGQVLAAGIGMLLALLILSVGRYLERKIERSRRLPPPPNLTDD
ncbi:hypothetical protein D3C78_1436120 [compost metagenome]